MDLARAQPEWAKRLHFVEWDPAAVLITEYYGESEQELAAKIDRLQSHLESRGWRGAVTRVMEPARQREVWAVRKAGLNILMSRRGAYKPITAIEDVSVPPERLAEYIGQLLDFCRSQGDIPDVAVYAHASAGCLHVRPLINPKSARGMELVRAGLSDFACDLALRTAGQ